MTFVFDNGTVVDRGEFWTIAVNRNQASLGRVIVVLNRACHDVRELTADEWAALRHEIGRVTTALDGLFRPDHYNYAFLMNIDSQVHLHVTPRYATSRRWQGMEFIDGRGEAPPVDMLLPTENLTRLARTVRDSLSV